MEKRRKTGEFDSLNRVLCDFRNKQARATGVSILIAATEKMASPSIPQDKTTGAWESLEWGKDP